MKKNNELIQFRQASLGYRHALLLQDLDFTVRKGDFIALLGSNGAGKTTLFKSILRQTRLVSGSLLVESSLIIGYVPQIDLNGFFWPIVVYDFLALFVKRTSKTKVEDVLKQLHIFDLATKSLQELSGGQRQKVLLARALLNDPSLLILDEPTQAMDLASEEKYMRLLIKLNRDGLTILMATHLVNLMLSACRQALILHEGKAIFSDVESLTQDGDILSRAFGCEFNLGSIAGQPVMMPSRGNIA